MCWDRSDPAYNISCFEKLSPDTDYCPKNETDIVGHPPRIRLLELSRGSARATSFPQSPLRRLPTSLVRWTCGTEPSVWAQVWEHEEPSGKPQEGRCSAACVWRHDEAPIGTLINCLSLEPLTGWTSTN